MELFGPLTKDYCNIFYVYSMIALVGGLFLVISLMYSVLKTRPKNWKAYAMVLLAFGGYILVYLRERLLYNMCMRA